jgi:flagellar basal-body rod protein FlgC
MINFFPGIQSTASALAAERIRMEVVSQNIANANTTRGLDGKAYQRQQAVFETVLQNAEGGISTGPQTVRVARIETDRRAPRLVYDPGHPDANAEGMVATPDINIHEEMADLIVSSRAFEANLAVVKNARQMALQSLSIGKH